MRYQPIRNLWQDAAGRIHFGTIAWKPGLPLHIFEDNELATPQADRAVWLSQWHTDSEWLLALHWTKYSNGLIGLYEEMARHPTEKLSANQPGLSEDERLTRRLARRERNLTETYMLLVGNNHWNFDVRGFNPGGNHGSLFRISTHSTFMLVGGDKTSIPQAAIVEEPYDSLELCSDCASAHRKFTR
ncbi:MAG: hypothetical protein M3R69_01030 [Acidobacteriota bacterium]|nr:hypothetical protein [Acidobacteriota bacterium]